MKAVLDTNYYCLCDTGSEKALDLLQESETIWLPSIVYGELYYGFKNGNKFISNYGRLNKFIEHFNVGMIDVSVDVARNFGDIYAALRKKGKPIPTNDIWIAACCLEIGGTLLTLDKHFQYIPQIRSEVI